MRSINYANSIITVGQGVAYYVLFVQVCHFWRHYRYFYQHYNFSYSISTARRRPLFYGEWLLQLLVK